MTAVIDAHTHFVPPDLSDGAGRDPRWPVVEHASATEAAIMVNGAVFRRVDSRCWDLAPRLAEMDAEGVHLQVLSPMPELLSHWLPPADAEQLATMVNEYGAAMVARCPQRFVGIGMICVHDVDRALRQLQAVKALGLVGIEIGSHINGVPLGDASLQPIYAAAQDLGLCIFVHPLHPLGMERIGGAKEFAAAAAFPLETAFAATALLANDIPARYPRLRFLLSHGGGALPWILPRLDFAWTLGGALQKVMSERPAQMAKRFWLDSAVYEPELLRLMVQTIGGERLVVGSDYPFIIRQKSPGAFVQEALADSTAILHANALAYLYGDSATLPRP